MPRAPRQPAYRLHKARNCAVVTIDGKNRYLGPYDSPQSHEQYARLIAEWQAQFSERGQPDRARPRQALSVNEVLQAFWLHAKTYYVCEGRPTAEQVAYWSVIRTVQSLYGTSPVIQFGPLAPQGGPRASDRSGPVPHGDQQADQQNQAHLQVGSRRGVDSRGHLRSRAYRGGTPVRQDSRSRIEEGQACSRRPGRCGASAGVQAGRRDDRVAAAYGHAPGEVVVMRGTDIDRTGDVWVYEPHQHKNRWRRPPPIGPAGTKGPGNSTTVSRSPRGGLSLLAGRGRSGAQRLSATSPPHEDDPIAGKASIEEAAQAGQA